MLCAAFQLQQICFDHLEHRQRLVTMSHTFISFAQISGGLFLPLTSQPPGDGFFPPHSCFVNTLPYIKTTSLVSTSSANLSLMNQIKSFQIISDQVICHGISVLLLFVLMSTVFLLSPGQMHFPRAFVRCIQRWGLILLNSVSNNYTSIPPF